MAQAPDFGVTILDYKSGDELFSLNLKVKHLRQFEQNGRKMKQHGGHTVIFDTVSSTMFSAKCRMNEQFSRRKGVLTCIQKMLDNLPFRGLEANPNGKNILSFHSGPEGMEVYIGLDGDAEKHWWLK